MILMFFYITKLQNTCIAYKTWSLQLLEHGESDGLALLVEGENMLILDSTSAVVGGA